MTRHHRAARRASRLVAVAVTTGALAMLAAGPAAAHVLIETVEPHGDGTSTLNGFRYVGEQPGQPATPASFELEDLLDALREATRVDGKAPWRACVVKLDKASGKATVDFAYEDADDWRVTPANAAEIARRARP